MILLVVTSYEILFTLRSIILIILSCVALHSTAQYDVHTATTKHMVDSINRLLDRAVVHKQLAKLQRHYASDFVFTHSTGHVDSKSSWIKSTMDTSVHFISREHDSVYVELHKDIAIVAGTLTVHRRTKAKDTGYALRYIRVFVYLDSRWQLLSHISTKEWELNS